MNWGFSAPLSFGRRARLALPVVNLFKNGDLGTGDLTDLSDTSTGAGTAMVVAGQLVLMRIDSSNQGQIQQIIASVDAGDYILSWDAVSGLALRSQISGLQLSTDNPRSFTWGGGQMTISFNVNGNGTGTIDNIVLVAA